MKNNRIENLFQFSVIQSSVIVNSHFCGLRSCCYETDAEHIGLSASSNSSSTEKSKQWKKKYKKVKQRKSKQLKENGKKKDINGNLPGYSAVLHLQFLKLEKLLINVVKIICLRTQIFFFSQCGSNVSKKQIYLI